MSAAAPAVERPSCYLFIGGNLDGDVRRLMGRPGRYVHHYRVGEVSAAEEYVLEPVEAERLKVFYLYRHNSMSMAEVVVRLISAYAEVHR
jgi:hypothetical protein